MKGCGVTTADAITVHALYDTDAVFRALVNEWVEHRRCPLPLVDRCLDFGLESAADCARWAATEPERPVWTPLGKAERGGVCGPYPMRNTGNDGYWYWSASLSAQGSAGHIAAGNISCDPAPGMTNLATPLAAILWLLANWQPAGEQA